MYFGVEVHMYVYWRSWRFEGRIDPGRERREETLTKAWTGGPGVCCATQIYMDTDTVVSTSHDGESGRKLNRPGPWKRSMHEWHGGEGLVYVMGWCG